MLDSFRPSRTQPLRRFAPAALACASILVLHVNAAPATAADEEPAKPAKLLGACTADALTAEPYEAWYRSGYDDYTPHPQILKDLQNLDRKKLEDVHISVYFGTWCGDSRREVPRLLRLLDDMESAAEVSLIAVDNSDELYKRSPGGEEAGQAVFRVPTIVVSRQGDEIGRIVEHPVRSLERDLLAILTGSPNSPAYRSYPLITEWQRSGLLDDPNVDPHGLAADLRPILASESELWSAARVFLSLDETDAALKVLQVNCAIYRTSTCAVRLARALRDAGRHDDALKVVDRALRRHLDPPQHDPDAAGVLLQLKGELTEPQTPSP